MATARAPAPPKKTVIYKKVPLSLLSAGYRLLSPALDDNNKSLLAAGEVVTPQALAELQAAGVAEVSIDAVDWANLPANAAESQESAPPPAAETAATTELDEALEFEGLSRVSPSDQAFSQQVRQHGTAPYDAVVLKRQTELLRRATKQVGVLVAQLNNSESVACEKLTRISHSSVIQAAEDMDLFVSLGLSTSDQQTLLENSASVSRLAIAIGANLGFDEEQLNELGAGCLVHDAGMLRLEEKFKQEGRTLDPANPSQVARHPIIAADMLYERMERVPLGVRMVVYQMHERCDGSGYPRGTTGDRIHYLSKAASIAEAYIALVSPPATRQPLTPYEAVSTLLKETSRGRFERDIARALLETVSLFPIGSLVGLSDGRIGRVFRANGAEYDKPVVQAWRRDRLKAPPETVDLKRSTTRVVRALGRAE